MLQIRSRREQAFRATVAAAGRERALLHVERIPRVVWEPACGPGAIVRELRAAGHIVHASDLVDYGCPDSEARVDFLMEWRAPPGVECAITNPPNKLATEFAEHALQLCPLVMLLLDRIDFEDELVIA